MSHLLDIITQPVSSTSTQSPSQSSQKPNTQSSTESPKKYRKCWICMMNISPGTEHKVSKSTIINSLLSHLHAEFKDHRVDSLNDYSRVSICCRHFIPGHPSNPGRRIGQYVKPQFDYLRDKSHEFIFTCQHSHSSLSPSSNRRSHTKRSLYTLSPTQHLPPTSSKKRRPSYNVRCGKNLAKFDSLELSLPSGFDIHINPSSDQAISPFLGLPSSFTSSDLLSELTNISSSTSLSPREQILVHSFKRFIKHHNNIVEDQTSKIKELEDDLVQHRTVRVQMETKLQTSKSLTPSSMHINGSYQFWTGFPSPDFVNEHFFTPHYPTKISEVTSNNPIRCPIIESINVDIYGHVEGSFI